MAALEEMARDAKRTLLVLDTVTGCAAERLFPDGRRCDTTVFFKQL